MRPFWEEAYADPNQETFGLPSAEVINLASRLSAGARVLDAGCGEGRHALYLARRGYGVDALDLSDRAIAKLKRKTEAEGLHVSAWVKRPFMEQTHLMRTPPRVDYGAVADCYARYRRAHPEVLVQLSQSVTPAFRVLEVGCGTGNYLSAIRGSVGCECIGMDPSRGMLEWLRKRDPGIHAVEGRAEQLPLPDASFDLVYSVDVIHHVAHREKAFREAFRILRAGGRVCTVTDSEWIIRNRAPLSTYFPGTVPIELSRYPSMHELKLHMLNAGFASLHEEVVEYAFEVTDATPYREKTFSSLLHLDEEAFRRGLARLETDLTYGPIQAVSRYVLLWGTR
jgi:ubiquinone/menaquinone biosynthesis C-methylase UbiE